jgi:hypothetical protein
VFFTTDLFSGLVWSFPLNTNRKKSPYTIESLSLSLSLLEKTKSKKKPSFNPFPSRTLARNKTMQNDGSLLSLLLRKISSGFPHLLHHDKHFRVFHTNFRRGPASSSNLESTAYHHHIY